MLRYLPNGKVFGIAIALAVGWTIAVSQARSLAQVAPDDSLGAERSQVIPRAVPGGPGLAIEGGAIRGRTLFQSFTQFNVGDGQRVYFANPTGVEAIFGRVTGASASRILGTLGVEGRADLFLLNPNGILFGANARLDIAGSFVASTAERLEFEDGQFFSAQIPNPAPLLTVNLRPRDYGSDRRGDITSAGDLTVGAGQSLTLAGNTVTLSGSLTAPGGAVTLLGDQAIAVSDATINTSPSSGIDGIAGSVTLTGGNVAFTNSTIDARSVSSSTTEFPVIQISGTSVLLDRAYISTTNNGSGFAGDIAITASDRVEIFNSRGSSTRLPPGLFSQGNDGRILIGASDYFVTSPQTVQITNSQLVTNNSAATGDDKIDAGEISIQAADSISLSHSTLTSSTTRAGDAGTIALQATGRISLSEGSRIQTNAERSAQGNAGGVTIEAGSFMMSDRSSISTSSFATGSAATALDGVPGNARGNYAGAVVLHVANTATLDNSFIFNNLENGASGQAGLVLILANSLNLLNGAEIQTIVRGANINGPAAQGQAGNILIGVNETIQIRGSRIFSSVGAGAVDSTGGNVVLAARSIQLRDRGGINASNQGQGAAGNVMISARAVWLDNQARIDAVSRDGQGGNIYFDVPGAIILGRGSNISTSAIEASTALGERAGNIAIGSGTLIEATSPQGTIVPTFTDRTLLVAGKTIRDSNIFAVGVASAGGNIRINAFSLQDIAQRPAAPSTNDITTQSILDVDGETVIDTLNIDPSQRPAPLREDYREPRIADGCDPRGRSQPNRFTIVGRGGTQAEATEQPGARPLSGSWATLPEADRRAATPGRSASRAAIVAAQGWTVAANGEIVLTAQAADGLQRSRPTALVCHAP